MVRVGEEVPGLREVSREGRQLTWLRDVAGWRSRLRVALMLLGHRYPMISYERAAELLEGLC